MLEREKNINFVPAYQDVLEYLHLNNCDWAKSSIESRLLVFERQEPKAIIVTCSDARTSPEQIFSIAKPGELFVIRLAGPTLPKEAIGTIEWAVSNLNNPQQVNIPLIIVLGHDDCGAVKATLEALRNQIIPEDNNIQTLIEGIKTGLKPVEEYPNTRAGVNQAVQDHVRELVKQLEDVHLLKTYIEENKLKIIGAFYCFDTGKVDCFI